MNGKGALNHHSQQIYSRMDWLCGKLLIFLTDGRTVFGDHFLIRFESSFMPRIMTSFLYFHPPDATTPDDSFFYTLEVRKIKLCHKISG
jgi:hypothetical protein